MGQGEAMVTSTGGVANEPTPRISITAITLYVLVASVPLFWLVWVLGLVMPRSVAARRVSGHHIIWTI